MSEQLSIFNIGENAAALNGAMFQQKQESSLFDPKLKDIKDVKVCIIRPIPLVKDPMRSLETKRYYALNDQAGTVIFDSRTTFNRPAQNHYEFCPVSDMWAKLSNSKDPNVQGRAKMLRLQTASFAYVQIVKFPGEEHLEGKIMPMRIPANMTKLFNNMANPSEQEIALGTVPTQPFDIIGGKNIKCTITGKHVNGVLMREWVVEALGVSELTLPLGANGAMAPVTSLPQDQVVAYLTEQQTEDLTDRYGYHEPADEAKMRVKAILQGIVLDIPALRMVADGYFPELPAPQPMPQAAPQAPQPAAYVPSDPMQMPQAAPQAPQAPAPQPATPEGEMPF